MIFQHRADGLLAITQPDHARLAGRVAEAWGGIAWRPAPWRPLEVAAHRHDDGWAAWEASPTLNESGEPIDFLTVPTPERVEIYRRSVDLVAGEHPHVGLLVSMHMTGLFLGRFEPDAQRSIDSLQGQNRDRAESFVAQQESWRSTLLQGADDAASATLDSQYRLLQVFDRLSLVLCMQPVAELEETRFGYVSLHERGPLSGFDLRVRSGLVVLDPYPLSIDPLKLSIAARPLPSTTFDGLDEYRRQLAQACPEELNFTLASGSRLL